MRDIIKAQKSFPSKSKLELEKLIFKEIGEEYNSVELKITIDDRNVNIKELSSYLDFIYTVDGSLSPLGFNSYSHTPRMQLEITRMKQGSWEIIIEKLLGTIDGQNLIILYMVLKYFPSVINATLDGVHRYYEIQNLREDYLEKKQKRNRRNPLRRAIDDDEDLKFATEKEKDKIYKLISKFYKNNSLAASRFAKKFIKKLELYPKKEKG